MMVMVLFIALLFIFLVALVLEKVVIITTNQLAIRRGSDGLYILIYACKKEKSIADMLIAGHLPFCFSLFPYAPCVP